MELNVEMLD